MPDDNSCLFRAFGTAVLPGDDLSMHELRSLVASAIQAQPEIYTKVVLEKDPDDYCRWIQTEQAWGGAIELGILASHFDIEICSIDVQVWVMILRRTMIILRDIFWPSGKADQLIVSTGRQVQRRETDPLYLSLQWDSLRYNRPKSLGPSTSKGGCSSRIR